MDVFSAFPQAIVSNVWEIGTVEKATEVGDVFTVGSYIDVIIDEGCSAQTTLSPNASQVDSDTLVYIRAEDMPAPKGTLMASYLLLDTENNQFYEIIDVGIGKNQETGKIEHVELKIRQTEAEYAVSEL